MLFTIIIKLLFGGEKTHKLSYFAEGVIDKYSKAKKHIKHNITIGSQNLSNFQERF